MTPQENNSKIVWRWGAIAALAMTLLALYPQINLWLARGSEWQGSYVLTQGDEVAYSAYVNALMDGRPRRNDPFNGRDDVPGKPTYESLFSIQFIPAYVVAWPARVLHQSVATVFIGLMVVGAITSSLAIFWLMVTLTGDSRFSAVGVWCSLCFGALAAAQGVARLMISGQRVHDMFGFLRRYQPSIVFPLFFVFCVFIYHALTSETLKRTLVYSLCSGLLFAILVFSYFFVWTATLAWFAGVLLLWILFRRSDIKRVLTTGSTVGLFAVAAIIPFFIVLSHRNLSMDETQLLQSTHLPDLFYGPELIGFGVLAVLGWLSWRKLIDLSDPLVLFTASLALLPALVFNQQVLTGKSLQPIHYKSFVANYISLVSVCLMFVIVWRVKTKTALIPTRIVTIIAIAALGWGTVEVSNITLRDSAKARLRDEVLPVTRHLVSLSREDGSLQSAIAGQAPFPVVYASTLDVAGSIPSDSSLAVLWALHTPACGVSLSESKERFYRYMYYSGLTPKDVAEGMKEGRFIVLAPLFGVERVIEGLTPDAKPITVEEMRAELIRYAEFSEHFSIEQATTPTLSYVVAPDGDAEPSYVNLDKWYEREPPEKVGIFKVYKVKLRQSK